MQEMQVQAQIQEDPQVIQPVLSKWEAHLLQLGSSPHSPQLEKSPSTNKTQHSQK